MSISDSNCDSDASCAYDLTLSSFVDGGFRSCSSYRVGILVFGPDVDYCPDEDTSAAKTVWTDLTLKEEAPPRPERIVFVNFDDTFWRAELRWSRMEEEEGNCVGRFRQEEYLCLLWTLK